MQRPLLLLALIGLVIIAGVSLAGYYFGKLAEERRKPAGSPSPEATASPESSPSFSPSPSPSTSPSPVPEAASRAIPKPLPTAPPSRPTPKPQVRGQKVFPKVLPTIPPGQEETPASSSATGSTGVQASETPLRVSFVGLPGQVRSGQSFVVEWRVDGPSGAQGTRTTLVASYQVAGDGSSSLSSSEQSFGSFAVPRTFSTQLSYGGSSGTIHLTVSVEVGGTTVETSGTVELVN